MIGVTGGFLNRAVDLGPDDDRKCRQLKEDHNDGDAAKQTVRGRQGADVAGVET